MGNFLHNYILTLICTAFLCSIALILTPDSRAKKAVAVVCGITMITAIILPLVKIDFSEYSKSLAGYRINAQKYADNGSENRENLNRLYIEEQCQAYILDKAEFYGIDVSSASVIAEWSNDGYWYPVSAKIQCNCSDTEKSKLEAMIEADLGIDRDNQEWSCANEEQ